MKNPFTLGAAAGITSVLVAVPALAQLSFAQEASTSSSGTAAVTRPAPGPLTQEDVQSMIEKDTAFLANIDALTTLQKSAIQTHLQALNAAATIQDDTARQEAVRAAHDALRTTMQDAFEANPDLKSAMHIGPGGHRHSHERGFGHGPGHLAEKLGMTQDELKTALDSGKTIEDLAQEKGIELPPRPAFGGPMDR